MFSQTGPFVRTLTCFFFFSLFRPCEETQFGSRREVYQQEKLGQIAIAACQGNQNFEGTTFKSNKRTMLTFQRILDPHVCLSCSLQELKHENIVGLLDCQVKKKTRIIILLSLYFYTDFFVMKANCYCICVRHNIQTLNEPCSRFLTDQSRSNRTRQ